MKDKYQDCPTAPLRKHDENLGNYFFTVVILIYIMWLIW